MHQCDRGRTAVTTGFEEVAELMAADGAAVLVLDLRGYGRSVVAGGGDRGAAEPARHVADVDAGMSFLAARLAQPGSRTGLLGASCGGRFGLALHHQRPDLVAAVLLSSRLPAELDISDSLAVFAIAAADDPNRGTVESMQRLFAAARHRASNLTMYKGDRHGAPLLDLDPDLGRTIAIWMVKQLRD